ncbi:DNA-processing protein DprA [Paenibacillus sp. 1P03SA]|uniref:DNA-processing protein DprA n=1 Tax=Paenibacillus sp. 1P03SA TaxID=3132294 RepID=UPI0039A3D8F9
MRTFGTVDELKEFLSNELLFSSEAASYLEVSTQRLNQLVHSGKLQPIKATRGASLFLKSDLDERKNEANSIGISIKSETKMIMTPNDTVLQEALNYFTIQTFFNYSDKKTEPQFARLCSSIDMNESLLNNLDDISKCLMIPSAELKSAFVAVQRSFERLSEDDLIVKRGTGLYPKLLELTQEAPPYLFMRGNPNLTNYSAVAVVGTRHPSEDGKKRAARLAKLLGQHKIVVSSGLAMGIDTAAHRSALDANKPTIAVIGTPITKAYPKENEKLQQEISERGLVISQFPPSAPVQRWHFPMRNAVMSGISLATAIIEAGETSGALKQADYALKQERIVFIPQSALDNEKLKWPKKYILRAGAEKFSKIDELIQNLEKSNIIESKIAIKTEDRSEQQILFDSI